MTLPLPDLDEKSLQVQPLARADTIPSSWYVHPGFHRFDQQHVLARGWQYVCAETQLTEPGQYVSEIIAGEPIVLVRDDQGRLRAWFNVCKHRGGPLVTDACGHTRMLQCKYHGWTYRLDGSLRGVPRFDRTELFDKRDFGLREARIVAWQGMVFVCLQEEPDVGFEDYVSGIAERIHPIRLSELRFEQRQVYDVACNWKVYVDNYLEGYHLPLVHPELCDVLDYRNYVTETYPSYSLQYSPLQEGENPYGSTEGEAFYYCLFPNFMLNILPGRVQVNSVVPVSHDRCQVIFDYYFREGTPQTVIDEDVSFSDKVQAEDVEICEFVQRGLASSAYDKGRFSADAEPGVYHFQSILKGAYKRAMERERGVPA
ncbi:MAG: Rieske 2Fe-2S domain-containing protein [Rhodothermales bacterium]|nr:Rieske 2Fe-2S domain-containing protein [Rhodothermales bacterium]MBO6778757.1 Rieske 2Fe-2S domain-containing protein [Rhodothermales bacterium]